MKKGYVKISKDEFVRHGGLSNRDLFTRQTAKGVKTYWRIPRN